MAVPKVCPKPSKANLIRSYCPKDTLCDHMSSLGLVRWHHHPYCSTSWSWGMRQWYDSLSGMKIYDRGHGRIVSLEPWAHGEINFLADRVTVLIWFFFCAGMEPRALSMLAPFHYTIALLLFLESLTMYPRPGILNAASAFQTLGSWACTTLCVCGGREWRVFFSLKSRLS